jgi:uncharacterized protein (TIGR02466 family)
MLALTPELSLVFATPVSLRTVADAVSLNVGLERIILARQNNETGTRVSNVGGWQSAPDLFDWPEPEIQTLAAEIDYSVQQIWALPVTLKQRSSQDHRPAKYWSTGWANVNHAGDYNKLHMHQGHHLSAVYYVATMEAAPGPTDGRLELRDPRPAANYCYMGGPLSSGSIMIGPTPGLLVVFPAWIEHMVHPFRGNGHRISIAINISITSD